MRKSSSRSADIMKFRGRALYEGTLDDLFENPIREAVFRDKYTYVRLGLR